MKLVRLNRFELFLVGLMVCGLFYAIDCIIALALKIHPELPWSERGMYAGPAFLMTTIFAVAFLGSLIFGKKK